MNPKTELPEEAVTDLGAATELTLGVWDPMLKENLIMPQSRDF
ncbi:hypothetical protein [Terricaulis sp.]|nr:hypothetical protein [Terricaulis sp.]MDZ4690970.1 hypothetical protein [Terricaulis sp.]